MNGHRCKLGRRGWRLRRFGALRLMGRSCVSSAHRRARARAGPNLRSWSNCDRATVVIRACGREIDDLPARWLQERVLLFTRRIIAPRRLA